MPNLFTPSSPPLSPCPFVKIQSSIDHVTTTDLFLTPPSSYELILPSKPVGVMSQWHRELTDWMWYLFSFFSFFFLSVALITSTNVGGAVIKHIAAGSSEDNVCKIYSFQ